MLRTEIPQSVQRDLCDLLAHVARHDVSAFHSLYRKVMPKLKAYAGSIVRDTSLAEDILQISFVRIWENAASYDSSRGSALGWMLKILRNAASDELRKLQAAERRNDAVAKVLETQPRSYENASIDDYLSALGSDQAQAIYAVYAEGLTHAELADRLDIPLGTIKSRVTRGLAAIRRDIVEGQL